MAIRLLVAVTVGIATLSLLVPLPENVADSDTEEVTVEPSESQVTLDAGETNMTVTAMTTAGKPVENATIVVRGHSLLVADDPQTFETGRDSHRVTLHLTTDGSGNLDVGFRETQHRGTISFDVVPPDETGYVDDRSNPAVTVLAP